MPCWHVRWQAGCKFVLSQLATVHCTMRSQAGLLCLAARGSTAASVTIVAVGDRAVMVTVLHGMPCSVMPCSPKARRWPARRKAQHRAVATCFYDNVFILLYWQAQLLSALTQVT